MHCNQCQDDGCHFPVHQRGPPLMSNAQVCRNPRAVSKHMARLAFLKYSRASNPSLGLERLSQRWISGATGAGAVPAPAGRRADRPAKPGLPRPAGPARQQRAGPFIQRPNNAVTRNKHQRDALVSMKRAWAVAASAPLSLRNALPSISIMRPRRRTRRPSSFSPMPVGTALR